MRDNLLKNNIIKADKAVIDIGSNTTKILSVHYTAKEIVVEDAEIVSSGGMNVFNFVKFANRINTVLKGKKRKDIVLSLPSNMTESKIVSVKNWWKGYIPRAERSTYGRWMLPRMLPG